MELLKVILPAMIGFIAAFLAEPVKNLALYRHKKKRLKIAIYKEIVSTLNGLSSYLNANANWGIDVKISDFLPSSFIVYDHAQTDPILFHELKESILIDEFYRELKILKEKEDSVNKEKFQELVNLIVKKQSLIIGKKGFDRKVIRKFQSSI